MNRVNFQRTYELNVAEAVKAFEGNRSTLEMLDAVRYEITQNAQRIQLPVL